MILNKLCDQSPLNRLIASNERLINKVIQKFLNCETKQLIKYLLEFISLVSNENASVCKALLDNKISEIIPSYIRNLDSNTKIHSISLMITILCQLNISLSLEPLMIYSVSILINIIREEKNISNKIKSIKTLTVMNQKSKEIQNIFFNIEGVDILLKEFKSLFSEEKVKEIEDLFKRNKDRKSEKVIFEDFDTSKVGIKTYYKGKSDEQTELKINLIECLAASSTNKEDSRKKIVESKEMILILSLLEDNSKPILLLSALKLILTLSRTMSKPIKMALKDNDIVNTLFKYLNHPNIEIGILVTNSICNFLVDHTAVFLRLHRDYQI